MKNPNITQEAITQNTGISKKDVKAIILDLKGSGLLLGTFSSTTGQMQLASPPVQNNSASNVAKSESDSKSKFLKSCGTQINPEENALYCPHCGSSL